jgi:hypothetical protein
VLLVTADRSAQKPLFAEALERSAMIAGAMVGVLAGDGAGEWWDEPIGLTNRRLRAPSPAYLHGARRLRDRVRDRGGLANTAAAALPSW